MYVLIFPTLALTMVGNFAIQWAFIHQVNLDSPACLCTPQSEYVQ